MEQIKRHFVSVEAAHLSGLSRHMIDYLCRTGVVRPSGRAAPGRGRHRHYTFGDVVLLKAISGLLTGGLPVRKLKTALDQLRKRDFKGLTEASMIGRYLITDGKRIFLRDRPNALEDLTASGQFAFAFVVDIQDARSKVVALAQKQRARYYRSAG